MFVTSFGTVGAAVNAESYGVIVGATGNAESSREQ